MIHDVNSEPIPQVSSQDISMYSKYDLKDRVFLTQFYSCKRATNWNICQELHIHVINGVKHNSTFPENSQEPSMSSKKDFKDMMFLTYFFHSWDLIIDTKPRKYIYKCFPWYLRMTPSSKSSQKPSTSSKNDSQDWVFLAHLYSWKIAEYRQTTQDSHMFAIHDIENDQIAQV